MKALSPTLVAALCGGELIHAGSAGELTSVSTDTRTIVEGALFVALTGERFDGHQFVTQAAAAGASALMVSSAVDQASLPDKTSVIRVPDTLLGLQELARGYRKEHLTAKVVAITGSNGKTSTKDMIRTVLGHRFRVAATAGNFNNHIGLPLSILSTESDDAFGIWEIGMNHPGEIAPLARIAAPDIAVITNIGTAHIGNMGSQEAIAQEKGELAVALQPEGLLVLNADDTFTPTLRGRTQARVVTAGIEKGDVQAQDLEAHPDGTRFALTAGQESARVALPIPGRHMVSNALLAAAVGKEAGLSLAEIADALSAVELTPGRLQTYHHQGVRVIDDAYNANPDSMRASLKTVAAMPIEGKRFALLGGMGELGEESENAHREIGELARDEGFDHICSVQDKALGFTDGLQAAPTQSVHHFASHEEAARFLQSNAHPGDLVLLKGSRAAAMDKIFHLFAATTT